MIKDDAGTYIQQLMTLLLNSEDYAEKKGLNSLTNFIFTSFFVSGAAYGLAGFIKGLGILSVKQYNVLNELTEAIQDKSNARRREGINQLKFRPYCLLTTHLSKQALCSVWKC